MVENATWLVDPFLPPTKCPRTSILKNGMVVEKLPKNHLRPIRKRSCPSFFMSLSFPMACMLGQGLNFNPREIEGTRIVFKKTTVRFNAILYCSLNKSNSGIL